MFQKLCHSWSADSYLVTDGQAAWPGARQRRTGSHMGAAWCPLTCSLCSSAGRQPQDPGCWCPWNHDPGWSGLGEERKGQSNIWRFAVHDVWLHTSDMPSPTDAGELDSTADWVIGFLPPQCCDWSKQSFRLIFTFRDTRYPNPENPCMDRDKPGTNPIHKSLLFIIYRSLGCYFN